MRRWLTLPYGGRQKFSLRSALPVVALCAVCLAVAANYLNRVRARRAIATDWARRGARLVWDSGNNVRSAEMSCRGGGAECHAESGKYGFASLRSVRFGGPGFNKHDVANLAHFSVTRLELDRIVLDSNAIATITQQRNLKELYFVGCGVTPAHVKALKSLNNLRLLSLRGQPLSETHLGALESIHALRVCDIEGSGLAALRLGQLLQNSSIEILRVSHCSLSESEGRRLRLQFTEKVLFFE